MVNNFILDSTFCAVAQKFAQQLADSNFTSIHNPPFNPFSSRALSLAKFDCNLGEAIAISYNTPLNQNSIEYLINSFLKSNSHKEILLKRNVKYVGIGIATSLVPNQEISKTVIVLIIGFTL
ncbi:MAG: CAP domain-containing protein [Candidatus Micrarchaeota archaeon]|nr:CAP domain-containing protein [Candidatus Micrarchaeota archaeon]